MPLPVSGDAFAGEADGELMLAATESTIADICPNDGGDDDTGGASYTGKK